MNHDIVDPGDFSPQPILDLVSDFVCGFKAEIRIQLNAQVDKDPTAKSPTPNIPDQANLRESLHPADDLGGLILKAHRAAGSLELCYAASPVKRGVTRRS